MSMCGLVAVLDSKLSAVALQELTNRLTLLLTHRGHLGAAARRRWRRHERVRHSRQQVRKRFADARRRAAEKVVAA